MLVGQVVPMVLEADGRGERSFDIYSRLLRERAEDLSERVRQTRGRTPAARARSTMRARTRSP